MSVPFDSQEEPESNKSRTDSSRERYLLSIIVALLACGAIGIGIRTSRGRDVHASSHELSAVSIDVDANRSSHYVVKDRPALDPADKIADTGKEGTLAKRIRTELNATGAFNLEHVQVKISDGVVTLVGHVRSQAEKLLAEQLVRNIDGVEAVTNELDVIAIPFRASTSELAQRSLMAQSGDLW